MAMLADFHLLRPWWLLTLLPAILASWWLDRQHNHSGNWQQVIAPELLPFLVDGSAISLRRSIIVAALFGWFLTTLAMAGPTWERTPLPVHKQESALVVLFDLSPSMLAQDLKPNRLTRARLKLIELLQQRKEGTTGLVAYAADSFVVSPLTDDAATVAALVPALDPNIMPGQGSNVEAALNKGIELAINAGLDQADILLITDEVSVEAQDEITSLLRGMGNFRFSVLGVGTAEGAPIPLSSGGFAKDHGGAIVIPKLNQKSLRSLTNRHSGRFSSLSADDSDIRYLADGFSIKPGSPSKQLDRTFDSWHDLGYWLVLPLLPILLLAFRRGLLAGLLLLPLLGSPQQAMAFGWDDLWLTPDQQAARAMSQGDTQNAQQTFKDPNWKAAAAYRNGDFEGAEQLYQQESATAQYNRGNALAKAGKLNEALESYNKALNLEPDMADAKANRELVEQLLKQQQDQQQNQQGDSSNDQKNPQQDQNNSQDQNEQQQNQSESDQQDDENASSSSQNQSQDNQQQNKQSTDPQNNDPKNEDQQQGSSGSDQQDTQEEQQKQQQTPQQQDQQAKDSDGEQTEAKGQPQQVEAPEMSDEEKQAMEQWLRKIPDDPGGLLREKFRYEAKKRNYEQRRGISPPGNAEERW